MKVLTEIPEILERHTVILDKKHFASWKEYLDEYLSKGGIIEGCPPSDSVTSLSVDVLIEPTGTTKIISAADQINGSCQFKCLGYTFPQLSVEPNVLKKITNDICDCCKVRGIFGYLVINYVTFIDPISLQQRVWPIGLGLSYGISNSSYQILCHVTKGAFDFDSNAYTAPVLSRAPRTPHRSGRRKTAKVNEEKSTLEGRYAVFSHVLQHESLRSVQSSVLFQLCKSHGIGFDVKAKLGTLFTVIDQFHKDSFGILTIGRSMQEALSSFALNLSLIHRDVSLHKKLSKSNIQDLLNNIQLILDISVANMEPQKTNQPIANDDNETELIKSADEPQDEAEAETDVSSTRLPCPSPVSHPNSAN